MALDAAQQEALERFHAGIEKLAEFQTKDHLAAFLADLGVKGRRRLAPWCPVAMFLKNCTGDVGDLRAGTMRISYAPDEDWLGAHFVTVDTPTIVADFMHSFDSGDYPDLDEDPRAPAPETEIGSAD